MPRDNCYIALLHYPVYNKKGIIVTTAVTNMDIHDISRAARTYGVKRFYIITPFEEQKRFVERILRHWQKGYGASYNPLRKQALDITDVKNTLDDAVADIANETGGAKVNLVITGASVKGTFTKYAELKHAIAESNEAYLLLFGTGWGIARDVVTTADVVLEPIHGLSDYNHLSVRSAVSIILDRLFGKR